MVAVAVVGGAVIGGVATAYSGNEAAKAQESAANKATQTELQMYDKTRADLAPYRNQGIAASNMLMGRLPELTEAFTPDQAWLESTPGYQFTLSQGLKATQNSYAAKGLGTSGAALKGGADYATGLADSTWLDQFNADLAQKQQIYNMLTGQVQVGANAAAQTGSFGTQTAQSVGSNLIGAGNATAAGYIATGKGISDAANGAVGGYLYGAKNGLFG